MKLFSTLSSDAQRFVSYLAYGDRTRTMLASIAIGKTLSNTASLPTGEVEDIEVFYKTTVLIGLQSKLSALNELVVVDCEAVLDYARRFYLTRYRTAFPSKKIFCCNSETAVEDFMGLTLSLDSLTIKLIRENPLDLTKLHNGLTDLFEKIEENASASQL